MEHDLDYRTKALRLSDNGLLGRDVRDSRTLPLSLRSSSLFRRVVSACGCALLSGGNILYIPRGYPLPSGRCCRGVFHDDAGSNV